MPGSEGERGHAPALLCGAGFVAKTAVRERLPNKKREWKQMPERKQMPDAGCRWPVNTSLASGAKQMPDAVRMHVQEETQTETDAGCRIPDAGKHHPRTGHRHPASFTLRRAC